MCVEFGATLNIGPAIPSLPYLYTTALEDGCGRIAAQGYRCIDLFLPDPGFIPAAELKAALSRHSLRLSAIATGGAWMNHRLHLCSPHSAIREKAEDFILQTIRLAGACGGSVILGLVGGFLEPGVSRDQAIEWLVPALGRLGAAAQSAGSLLLLETLNQRETNFLYRLEQGVDLLRRLDTGSVRLLADVYHVNLEESSVRVALEAAGDWIEHVHFADHNRRAPGFGELDFQAVSEALCAMDYRKCICVEAMPWPDSETAAQRAIVNLRRWFPAETGLDERSVSP